MARDGALGSSVGPIEAPCDPPAFLHTAVRGIHSVGACVVTSGAFTDRSENSPPRNGNHRCTRSMGINWLSTLIAFLRARCTPMEGATLRLSLGVAERGVSFGRPWGSTAGSPGSGRKGLDRPAGPSYLHAN